jgi:hypothetical protein
MRDKLSNQQGDKSMWYHDEQPIDEAHEGFIQYVLEFYGKDGIYPMGANVNHVIWALEKLLSRENYDFAADSIDRENIRDIMIEDFGLKFPEAKKDLTKI